MRMTGFAAATKFASRRAEQIRHRERRPGRQSDQAFSVSGEVRDGGADSLWLSGSRRRKHARASSVLLLRCLHDVQSPPGRSVFVLLRRDRLNLTYHVHTAYVEP